LRRSGRKVAAKPGRSRRAADNVFYALSNPTRRKVLEQLSAGPATVSELAASFVQHLSVLEHSRLVKSKKRGRVRTYESLRQRFKVAEDWLSEQRQMWQARFDRFDNYVFTVLHRDEADDEKANSRVGSRELRSWSISW
jgi:DNA-binding transcriptional ArsR family regulator